jgi:small subunit ribosomal protein S3Ae
MAKARSRAAARKVKDKWKAKNWYNVLAPPAFDNVTIAETLSDDPNKLIDRVSEVSLQDITNDFRKSHIKLFFKVNEFEGNNAKTQYIGHTLTSDYLRRMIRRKRSKIDAIYDVSTRDGAIIRIKPFATTDRRIQNSQKKIIRETMKNTISKQAKSSTLSEFIKFIIDGKTGSDIYKSCKKLYPVKRVEIYKTEVFQQPTIMIEEPKKPVTEEKPETPDEKVKETKEVKPKKGKAKAPKPEETKDEIKEPVPEEKTVTPDEIAKDIKEETKKPESKETKEDKQEKPDEKPKKKPKKETKLEEIKKETESEEPKKTEEPEKAEKPEKTKAPVKKEEKQKEQKEDKKE